MVIEMSEDPFEWLENLNDKRVIQWALEHDRKARSYVADISSKLYPRLKKILEKPNPIMVVVSRRGLYVLIRERDYYKIDLLKQNGETETIVKSKHIGRDIVFKAIYSSLDGRYIAFSYSIGGSDEGFVKILDTEQREEIETLSGRVGNIVFLDGDKFYYTRFYAKEKTPDGVEPPASRVFLRENDNESMVFGEGLPSSHFIHVVPTCNGKVLIRVSYGWTKSMVYGGDIRDPTSWRKIYGGGNYIVDPIGFAQGSFYVASYEDDGYGKIVSIGPAGRVRILVDSIPQEPLQDATIFQDHIVSIYLRNASAIMRIYDLNGGLVKEIYPKDKSTISSLSSTCDCIAFKIDTFRGSKIASLSREYDIHIVKSFLLDINIDVDEKWINSFDGTPIHVFIVKKHGVKNSNRVLVYGYGGFGVPVTPRLFPEAIPFIEDGGLFVVTNIRGGSEFGEEWHRAGMRENKQNVFNDFAAVLKTFREKGAKIAAWGRSNGGLLVGAIVTQYPQLLDVALIGYPVLDMLKFHKLYIGRAWIPEYGDPDDPRDKEFLAKYSPYHNIRHGVRYPKILVYTGLYDDRVHPAHAFKFVAKMLKVGAEIYLRVEKISGHAGATPEVKAAEAADIMAFVYKELGIQCNEERA